MAACMNKGEFARKQLEKQGWRQGKGLGKDESGISTAIKVGIKNDTAGLGHDIGEQFTFHWWDHVFNKTAKSLVVEEAEDGVKVTKYEGAKFLPLTNKRPSKHANKALLYGRFVKASSEAVKPEKDSDSEDEEEKDFSSQCSEDRLYLACGGRTAHKAARHGLKLNGKLKRIEEQEKRAMTPSSSRSSSPVTKLVEKKAVSQGETDLSSREVSNEKFNEKRKKTKKRKIEKFEAESVGKCGEKVEDISLTLELSDRCIDDGSNCRKKNKKNKSKTKKLTDDENSSCVDLDYKTKTFATEYKQKKKKKSKGDILEVNVTDMPSDLVVQKEKRKKKKRKRKIEENEQEDGDRLNILEDCAEGTTRKKKRKTPKVREAVQEQTQSDSHRKKKEKRRKKSRRESS